MVMLDDDALTNGVASSFRPVTAKQMSMPSTLQRVMIPRCNICCHQIHCPYVYTLNICIYIHNNHIIGLNLCLKTIE